MMCIHISECMQVNKYRVCSCICACASLHNRKYLSCLNESFQRKRGKASNMKTKKNQKFFFIFLPFYYYTYDESIKSAHFSVYCTHSHML